MEQKNPNSLAEAICNILSDKILALNLSKAGLETVKNDLNYDIFVKKMVGKYEMLARKNKHYIDISVSKSVDWC